jgi:hypothetical protein
MAMRVKVFKVIPQVNGYGDYTKTYEEIIDTTGCWCNGTVRGELVLNFHKVDGVQRFDSVMRLSNGALDEITRTPTYTSGGERIDPGVILEGVDGKLYCNLFRSDGAFATLGVALSTISFDGKFNVLCGSLRESARQAGQIRGPGAETRLGRIVSIDVDKTGNVYMATYTGNEIPRKSYIVKVRPDGYSSNLYSSEVSNYWNDSVCVDNSGNVFVGQSDDPYAIGRIVKLNPDGTPDVLLSIPVQPYQDYIYVERLVALSDGTLMFDIDDGYTLSVYKMKPGSTPSLYWGYTYYWGPPGIEHDNAIEIDRKTGNVFLVDALGGF